MKWKTNRDRQGKGAPTTALQDRAWEKPHCDGQRRKQEHLLSPGKEGWVVLLLSLSALGVGLAKQPSSVSHPTAPAGTSTLFALEGEIHQCLKM